MTRFSIVGLLIAICCLPSYARTSPQDSFLWLQPISYQEMREMMAKAKAMSKSDQGGRPDSQTMNHGEKGGMQGMKKGEKAKSHGRSGMRMRRTSLRFGSFPQPKGGPGGRPGKHAKDLAAGSIVWLERPDNTIDSATLKQRRSAHQAEYKADDGGWYRLFAFKDFGVEETTRVKYFSYYSFMSHGEKVGQKERQPMIRPGYFEDQPELELVEIHEDGEPRYSKYVGDEIRVGALLHGAPLAGARLILTTQQGWSQTRITDERGEAAFTLIKEDFPEDGVDRRKSELYLVRADHRAEVSGQYHGASYDTTRYIATMPFRVSPAKEDWQSQRIAYLVVIVTIIGSAVAIAIRRRRRKRA
jgi:hypothetical protein